MNKKNEVHGSRVGVDALEVRLRVIMHQNYIGDGQRFISVH